MLFRSACELDFVDEKFKPQNRETVSFIRTDFSSDNTPDVVFITYGQIVSEVVKAEQILRERGVSSGIILVEKIKPYSEPVEAIKNLISGAKHAVYVEEGIKNGGAAMITRSMLGESGFDFAKTKFDIVAIDDDFATPDKICDLYDYAGLSANRIIKNIKI